MTRLLPALLLAFCLLTAFALLSSDDPAAILDRHPRRWFGVVIMAGGMGVMGVVGVMGIVRRIRR